MMTKKKRDLKGVISREKRYSTLAEKEGDYAKKISQKEKVQGLREMEKDSNREAHIAYAFAKKRREIANREKDLLKGKT
jgi:hypothetical protein